MTPFLDILHYDFVIRGFEAGIVVAIIAPIIGIFLVLRRYALIADTLAHVSLAGLALGSLLGVNPVAMALVVTILSSLGIERLRTTRRVYGDSALALFLSGSLALAVVLLGIAHGFDINLLNYLFGSIITVTATDVIAIVLLGVIVIAILALFYKELVYVTFDEEAARVSGIPTKSINTLLMFMSALTVSLAIPIVGVLLIAALIVVPVITALQFRMSFTKTIICAEAVSIISVLAGIIASFYLNLATGGTIVLVMIGVFLLVLMWKSR
ncbi:MAG: metal ABC transporter permease [Candidatus Yonathbacteria bacterium CG_4_10_14_3_um_filter_47_65]|uniref:Metal ABC transporter permease n=2 Tax=Parcubacteria group TaxID=1794811 RepID=A0A2M8D634_9BACT|nr:MAG: metal ABC transporter permease [Candidatus Nomurabacteria bacterium CG1_02_47_685]PIP03274.1 MAG: metal ABC transporter permease [Candidatus Yonathbacteria bacterium CG23_combo_of_CG06-09_8_20_14_all_46_18]PIQ32079.1 MAG: metal ABC transporter permease [Candidatus Yonathbacteria bacterium CG17_big_fil_post_rev_8_21_14_2_50_46_19]PIX56380.1 MAG: metal ABC transporter permease [Candidatus Yonathbacteria bacterium CG_4_10_14_3_um_filter_47_65]PIY57379.1 MAG: metal ABC transporter permease 